MRHPLTYLLICLMSLGGYGRVLAQQHTEFRRENFTGRTAAFNVALKQYTLGKKQFDLLRKNGQGSYEAVYLLLQPAYAFNPHHERLNYMMGVAAFHEGHYEDAYRMLRQAGTYTVAHDSLLPYYTGLTEHALRMYDSSIVHLQDFLLHFPGNRMHDSTASKRIEESKYGAILVLNSVHTKSVRLSGNINTPFNEYFPVLGPDGTYLLFNRDEPDASKPGVYHTRIYMATAIDSGFGEPTPLPLNNLYNKELTALSLSSDGQRMLLRAKDRWGRWDIYESLKGSKDWGPPVLLPSGVNTLQDEWYATYTHHDSVIFIISNRNEGMGGYDIWKVRRHGGYRFGKAENLGNVINTPYNEFYVSVPADSTLIYFTSDGHATVGYTDLFRSRFDKGRWSKPSNAGYPLNNSLPDDQFMVWPSGMLGLHVKFDGHQSDIYLSFLPPRAKQPGLLYEERILSSHTMIITHTVIPPDE